MVHTYQSSEMGLFVNSYLVEGEKGVVAVDTPLLLSDGRAFRARLEALRKPLLAVLITHPHPDHYNTITELIAGESVPIVALPDVDREIRAKDEAKRAQWIPTFGDEWPPRTTFPNRIAQDGDTLEFDGLRFKAIDFGPGESVSETAWVLNDDEAAFVGDFVFNGVHSYLADGYTRHWIQSLRRAQSQLAGVRRLYVGHGEPTTTASLGEQRRYLMMVRETVGRIACGRAELSEGEAAEVVSIMSEYEPEASLGWLVNMGAGAVAAELSREAGLTRAA